MKRKKMSPLKNTGYKGSKTLNQVEVEDPKEKRSYPKAGEGEGANIERKDDEFIQSSGGNETGLARFEDYFPRAGKRSIERKNGRAKAREEMDKDLNPLYQEQGYMKEKLKGEKRIERAKKKYDKLKGKLEGDNSGEAPDNKLTRRSPGEIFRSQYDSSTTSANGLTRRGLDQIFRGEEVKNSFRTSKNEITPFSKNLPKKKSIVDSVGKVFDGKEVQEAVGGAFSKLFMRSAKYKK